MVGKHWAVLGVSGLLAESWLVRRKCRTVSVVLRDGGSVAGFFPGCAVGVFGILATADSDVPGGLIAFGGGVAVGVAMGRAKTVEWETR
jgi:hypothetical protein